MITDNMAIMYTSQNLERFGIVDSPRGPFILAIVSENLTNPIWFKKAAISSELRTIERITSPKAKVTIAK
ncbi:hypothetical protein ES703_70368 [subsurface metagenome]